MDSRTAAYRTTQWTIRNSFCMHCMPAVCSAPASAAARNLPRRNFRLASQPHPQLPRRPTLKCSFLPEVPTPASPVHSWRKFSAVLGTTSARSCTHTPTSHHPPSTCATTCDDHNKQVCHTGAVNIMIGSQVGAQATLRRHADITEASEVRYEGLPENVMSRRCKHAP